MNVIQIYAGDECLYDNRLPAEAGYQLLSIKTTEELNRGGSMTITLPPTHPFYTQLRPLTVPVELRHNQQIRWRGRILPPADDFYRRATVTCEGELCFTRDVVHRPYVFDNATPREAFAQTISAYNTSAEPWKRFAIGEVTVPAETIHIESQDPELVFDTLQRLLKVCGGYLIFTANSQGRRALNWYQDMPFACNQSVVFGSNLLDYNSKAASDVVTRIIPFGAVQDNGQRLKIRTSSGKDYVDNLAAIQKYGIIEKPIIYDKIGNSSDLERQARKDLAYYSILPRQITLKAVDLATLSGISADTFRPGQAITAKSSYHNLSGRYNLLQMQKDWLEPGKSTITLAAEGEYTWGNHGLSGATSAGNKANSDTIQDIQTSIQGKIAVQASSLRQTMQSKVDQTAESIRAELTNVLQKVNGVEESVQLTQSQIELLADELSLKFTQTTEMIEDSNGQMQANYEEITKIIRATIDGITIGESNSDTKLHLDNDVIEILVSGMAEMYINHSGLFANQVTVQTINIGNYTLQAADNGHFTLS